MSIKFDPTQLLNKVAPKRKLRKALSAKVSLKKTALSFVDAIDFLDRKKVTEIALKTIKGYRERIANAVVEGDRAAGKEEKTEILDDPKQLIQRVQNEVVFQAHEHIKDKYAGKMARWLPSDAEEPRPEHQLNYGKEYIIGEGINGVEPGDEWGCRCGVEILVSDKQLKL